MEPIRSELYIELIDAIAAIRGFFDARETRAMNAADLKMLERLFDRYQSADEAFGQLLEAAIRASAKRPRR